MPRAQLFANFLDRSLRRGDNLHIVCVRTLTIRKSDSEGKGKMRRQRKSEKLAFWQAPDYLRDVRESLGFSQQELSRFSGVSRAVISDIESGRTPFTDVEHALKLYMILDGAGSNDARRARLAVDEILKASIRRELAMVDREIDLSQKRRKSLVDRLAEIDTSTDFLQEIRRTERQGLGRKRNKAGDSPG
jgi:transcriptional regulator with XRE-family HTH domain